MSNTSEDLEHISDYAQTFDYMLEGCQIISRDYRYLYVNDVLVRQGGRKKRSDLINHTMTECYPGIENTEMYSYLRRCIEHGIPHTMENKFLFSNGTTGWFELHMEPLPEGAIILSIDITERKNAEEHTKRLEELKTTFMTIVSHQLRTPLSIIRGSLQSLQYAEIALDEGQRKVMIHTAELATGEIVSRLGEVLEALSAEGPQEIQKEPVCIDEIWAPIRRVYQQKAKQKRIHFIDHLPIESCPPLIGDQHRLSRVLESFAKNAVIYNHPNGTIESTISVSPSHVRFDIKDTGIGIPKDEQSRVFNRFFRGTNAISVQPDASGLSLAVAKYYIEQHGGTIGFTSKEGEGTTFWFMIPLEPKRHKSHHH